MKSRRMILPVSTSPERKFSIPSRRSALRKPGSRFTRARIVSLKSRVKAIGVTFLPLDRGESGGKFRTNRSELDHGKTRDSREIAEVQRRNYSSSGVFASRATADPSLVKSRTFQVSKLSAPAFTAQ